MTTSREANKFHFDDFTLDLGKYRLSRGRETIQLGKLTFELLRVLIQSAPNAVSHEQLIQRVWGPNQFVSPETLSQRVTLLRKALGDNAEQPRYIEVIRGQGYRLIPAVEAVAPPNGPEEMDDASLDGQAARSQAVNPGDSKRGIRSRWKLIYGGVLALVAIGLLVFSQIKDRNVGASNRQSLAVLPFDNLSTDPGQEYFVDGLLVEVINQLTQIENLRVVGQTSPLAYRGRGAELRTISKALGVEYVLAGSVRTGGDALRITVQLISVDDGSNVWSRTFAGDLNDVLDLQQEIAVAVAQELSLELGTGRPALRYGDTDNFEAYDHYLRGWALRDVAVDQAIEEFEAALGLDRNFARAWVGLAYSYGVLLRAATSHDAEREALRRMEDAALHAVELSPVHWAGYGALAWVDVARKDWLSANRRLQKVRDLAKQLGAVIDDQTYANFLHQIGRVEDALVENEAVRRLDPLSTFASFNIQIDLMLLGRFEEALAEFERNREIPGMLSAMHMWAIPWFIERGDYDAVEEGFELGKGRAFGQLADVWRSPVDALDVIRRASVAPGHHSRSDYSELAIFAAHYGDEELALRLMRDAYLGGGYAGFFLIWHPAFSEVRRTEGFKQFARDLGLVELWRNTDNWGDYCRPTSDSDFRCS